MLTYACRSYAVVVDYDPGEHENTFYATLKTTSIKELNGKGVNEAVGI